MTGSASPVSASVIPQKQRLLAAPVPDGQKIGAIDIQCDVLTALVTHCETKQVKRIFDFVLQCAGIKINAHYIKLWEAR